jgi:hypothetical protein
MTALSSLFPSSSGMAPYPSGVGVIGPTINSVTNGSQANRKILLPFVPRADVTVDKLWWYRVLASAGNVYMGLVDQSGNRLDDCAVDSDTTVGLHEIDTTNFDLTAGTWYGIIINQSADVMAADTLAASDEVISHQMNYFHAHPPLLTLYTSGTFPTSVIGFAAPFKDVTAAAVPDPETMTGWSGAVSYAPMIGIVPA